MAEDSEPEEFVVGAILDCVEFDQLVTKALESRAQFSPASVHKNRDKHSKYAYLVHWEGYQVRDRTWEPEANLKNCVKLKQYKKDHFMSGGHQKFDKTYGPEVWRNLVLASENVEGIQYLLTTDEINEKKAKKVARLAALDKQEIQKKDKPRERMITPEDTERILKKKKKMTGESSGAVRIPKKNAVENISANPPEPQIIPDKSEESSGDFRIPKKKAGEGTSPDNPPEPESVPEKQESSTNSSNVCQNSEETENRQSVEALNNASSCSNEKSYDACAKPIERPTALPGIKPLDLNTPRIQKKSSVCTPTYSSSPECVTATSSVETPHPIVLKQPDVQRILSNESSSSYSSYSSCTSSSSSTQQQRLQPLKLKKGVKGVYEIVSQTPPVEPIVEPAVKLDVEPDVEPAVERKTSECSTITLDSTPPETDNESIPEKEIELEEMIKEARNEYEYFEAKLKKYPIKVEAKRTARDFSSALNLRKYRRCQSEGQLCDFFNNNAEMEIFGKNYENSAWLENGINPFVIKNFPNEPLLKKQEKMITTEDEEEILYDQLVEENSTSVKKALINFRFDKEFRDLLDSLVIAYSKDDHFRFKRIIREQVPEGREFYGHRLYAVIVLITYCRHRLWQADPKGYAFVESNNSEGWGAIRQAEVLCCENHRKCTWMRVFLETLPDPFRFLETTGRCIHGWQGDDGPFRDDVFFHCMKYGSECQKRLFFEFNKPIGIQEEIADEYMVDAMHLLAVKYGNLQRIASYLKFGGVDINALATHMPTKRVLRLQEYLKAWVENNVTNNMDLVEVHKKYYRNLQDMIRLTNESLEMLLENEFRSMIYNRMDGRWKLHMDLSYPHILRCSPMNNVSNSGDGTHQVLCCLFYPQVIVGYRDGIDKNNRMEIENMEKLELSLQKFQKLVREKKGRLVLALYRIEVEFHAECDDKKYSIPIFKLIRSDEGFKINSLTILRQTEGLEAEEADIGMSEITPFSTPGCRYFIIQSEEHEETLIVPGNAHIEINGEFDVPMTFVTQVFFIKKNV